MENSIDITAKINYVYIGQYYHIKNKELPLDYKFGVTDNIDNREYSLSRTKSPIKYMILRAWELPNNVKREQVEKLIATIFEDFKYDGCEWYDIDGDSFQDKIELLFSILTNMFLDTNINFKEVDLNKTDKSLSKVEKIIESDIRSGKKLQKTNIKININNTDLSSDNARDGFLRTIKYLFSNIGESILYIDYQNIIKTDIENFPIYKQKQCHKISNFYIDTHSSTQMKRDILQSMINKYKLNGSVEII